MGLKISELVSALNKVSAAIGDSEVVFKAGAEDAETVLTAIELQLGADGTPTSTGVQLVHGPAPAEPEPAETPAEPEAPASDQVAQPATPSA